MILIIDDDSAVRSSLSFMLKRAGYEAQTVPGPREAMDVVRAEAPALILMDMNFTLSTTGEEGWTLLNQVKIFRPDVPVILMTAWGSIQLAVQGMQAGAFDFITKPWNNAALLQRIETALELTAVPKDAPEEQSETLNRSHIIGKSQGLMEVLNTVARIARTNASVLITGESGTGKELIAEAIHINSQRVKQPFVKVNLGGISQSLFESEMFGHKKGAFTDATTDRVGRFELANKGTIFLDEIGELPLSIQVKLLRVLESGEIQKIAHRGRLYSDFRLIGATNRTLPQMVREGKFREDLYHRLNVFEIYIPPLRERLEDLPLLMRYFIEQSVGGTKAKEIRVDQEVYRLFNLHSWPGNIRELKNVLTYALYSISENNILTKELLPTRFINAIQPPSLPQSHTDTVPAKTTPVWANDINVDLYEVTSDAERNLIKQALKKCRYNKSSVAKKLGISRNKLYRKLHEYGLLEASADDE